MGFSSLAGCTGLKEYVHNGFKVGPNHESPPAPVAADWIDAGAPAVSTSGAADCAWWKVVNDPILDNLIETAYRQNLDLQAAGARIMAARAQRGIAAGNLFPQSQTGVAAYVHTQLPGISGFPFP